MRTSDFDFYLPEELIAQTPLLDRSSSRLLVLDAETGGLEDKHFTAILDELNEGDALVLNNTRVLPARLHGVKPDTGGHIEVLLLNNTNGDEWETLVKPGETRKGRNGHLFRGWTTDCRSDEGSGTWRPHDYLQI